MEIIEFGNRLRLTNTSDETVSVPGYSAEPYLEISPDGVRRNENSPATYLNLSRDGPRHSGAGRSAGVPVVGDCEFRGLVRVARPPDALDVGVAAARGPR